MFITECTLMVKTHLGSKRRAYTRQLYKKRSTIAVMAIIKILVGNGKKVELDEPKGLLAYRHIAKNGMTFKDERALNMFLKGEECGDLVPLPLSVPAPAKGMPGRVAA